MHLPDPIIAILIQFQPVLSAPSYRKMVLLVCGTLLAHGRRTVTAALKMLGLEKEGDWSKYHHLLNRARWKGLAPATILLTLVVKTFLSPTAALEVVLDETLERRWGPNIKKKGHWRDSLASSRARNVAAVGLRWLVAALIVKLPWSNRRWALPFLAVLLTTPKVSAELGLRHRTPPERTAQVFKWLARTFPNRAIKVIGDGAYSVVELGLLAQKLGLTLIAPLRLDARLFDAAPERINPGVGRPRLVGPRLPHLSELVKDPTQPWQTVEVEWYGGHSKRLRLLSGTAIWYSNSSRCSAPLPIRWVLVVDPHDRLEPKAYFSTTQDDEAEPIVADFVKRWNIEVTFEESRAHLGVETQRQWNDLAIERTTPVLLGLYSLVCLFIQALAPDGKLELYQTAWYHKEQASFSDVLALVRKALWGNLNFTTSSGEGEMCLIPRAQLDRLIYAVCY